MQARKVPFEGREYGKSPLTERELIAIIGDGPIEKFLNTRTPLYRHKKMKENPPSKAEAVKLMLQEPNLLRRPVLIKGTKTLTGFAETEMKKLVDSATP